MRQPTVSVVIPCYNAAHFIRDSIQSLLDQHLDDSIVLEIIVVDDGSCDGSAELVSTIFQRYDCVTLYREPHRGIVPTVVRGLELARGKFIALQGADDISHTNRLQLQLQLLNRNNRIGLVYSDLEVIDIHGHLLADSFWTLTGILPERGRPIRRLLDGNFVSGGTLLFRRELLDCALPIPPFLPFEDWWLAFCAALVSEIDYLPRKLVQYRRHDTNVVFGRKQSGSYAEWLESCKRGLTYRRALLEKLNDFEPESYSKEISMAEVMERISAIDLRLRRLEGNESYVDIVKSLGQLACRLFKGTQGQKRAIKDFAFFVSPSLYWLATRAKVKAGIIATKTRSDFMFGEGQDII